MTYGDRMSEIVIQATISLTAEVSVWQTENALADNVHLDFVGATINSHSTTTQPVLRGFELLVIKALALPADALSSH